MLSEEISGWVVTGVGVYAAVGVLFAFVFVFKGVRRIDPAARESGWGFRVMIFPGSAALWPLLLKRWILGQAAPAESNAHRRAAGDPP